MTHGAIRRPAGARRVAIHDIGALLAGLALTALALPAQAAGQSAPQAAPQSTPRSTPQSTPQSAPQSTRLAAPQPVWPGHASPYAEPPLPAPPTVRFAVARLTQAAGRTVIDGVHGLPAAGAAHYRIGVFLHRDVFYWQRDALATPGPDGRFRVVLPALQAMRGAPDRALLVLYRDDADPLAGANCDAAGATCTTRVDPAVKLALPFDAAAPAAFTTVYFPAPMAARDAQIAGLQGLMNTPPVRGGPYGDGRLVRSFRDLDSAFLYDQALAVIAFSLAGERADADLVIRALAALQDRSGAWRFSYTVAGAAEQPGADLRIAGANAWFGMALNAYQKAFHSTRYLAMSTRLHDYLLGELVEVGVGGRAQRALRFAPTDYEAGRTTTFALEHQLDAYASLHQYHALNGGARYRRGADALRAMAESLWDGTRFLPGYDAASGRFNTAERYLDNYSWAVLALGNTGSRGQDFAGALPRMCDYFTAAGTLAYPSHSVSGVAGFYDVIVGGKPPPRPFVWSEGSLGAVMALRQGAPALACAGYTAAAIERSLAAMVDPLHGLPYATRNADPDFNSPASVAGTAWLYFARHGNNPYVHY